MIKPYNRALGAKRKQANLASLVEMHSYFPLRGTSPRESVSRDFQVAALPYKSRSLATPLIKKGEIVRGKTYLRLPKPSVAKPLSNFSPFRTLGPKGHQPSRQQAVSIIPYFIMLMIK